MAEYEIRVIASLETPQELSDLMHAISMFKGVDEVTTERSDPLRDINFSNSFGTVIEAWRRHNNLPVRTVLKRGRITQPYWSQLKHGKIQDPRPAQISKLAKGLGVPLSVLVTRQLPPQRTSED